MNHHRTTVILGILLGLFLISSRVTADVGDDLGNLRDEAQALLDGGGLESKQAKAVEKILSAVGKAEAIPAEELPKLLVGFGRLS